VGGQQKPGRDDAVGPPPEAADEEAKAAPIEGMEGAAMSVGPRGEIVLERSDSARTPPAGRTDEKSTGRSKRKRTAEPDENNHPSIAVNEEPSG